MVRERCAKADLAGGVCLWRCRRYVIDGNTHKFKSVPGKAGHERLAKETFTTRLVRSNDQGNTLDSFISDAASSDFR